MSKFLIGKITKTHGLKGQLKLQSFSEDFFSYTEFFDDKGKVIKITPEGELKNNCYIIALPSVKNINEAERCLGIEIYGDPQPLEQDEFYYADLIERPIYDEDNALLGIIDYVQDFGASPYVVIKKEDGTMVNAFFHKEAIVSIEPEKVVIKKEFLV